MIVQLIEGHAYKLIHWGTGSETPSLLYNLSRDESESTNLLRLHNHHTIAAIAKTLDENLKSVIPYESVARQVARYNHQQFGRWVNATGPSWVDAVHGKGLRWDASWDADPAGALKAVQQWMASPPDQVLPCRSALRWPRT